MPPTAGRSSAQEHRRFLSGGTSTGKATILRALTQEFGPHKRICWARCAVPKRRISGGRGRGSPLCANRIGLWLRKPDSVCSQTAGASAFRTGGLVARVDVMPKPKEECFAKLQSHIRVGNLRGFNAEFGMALTTVGKRAMLCAVDSDGNTLGHLAAAFGTPQLMRRLLDLGTDLNACNSLGQTPLVMALTHRNQGAVEAMPGYGFGQIQIPDNNGRTALHHLVAQPCFDRATLFKWFELSPSQMRAMLWTPDSHGCTPVNYAAKMGQSFAREAGYHQSESEWRRGHVVPNHRGLLAVHEAALNGNSQVMGMFADTLGWLVRRDGDVRELTSNLGVKVSLPARFLYMSTRGFNVAHLAAICDNGDVMNAVRQTIGDKEATKLMSAQSGDGWTPSTVAAVFGNLSALKGMHECGVDILDADGGGRNVASIVKEMGHTALTEAFWTPLPADHYLRFGKSVFLRLTDSAPALTSSLAPGP